VISSRDSSAPTGAGADSIAAPDGARTSCDDAALSRGALGRDGEGASRSESDIFGGPSEGSAASLAASVTGTAASAAGTSTASDGPAPAVGEMSLAGAAAGAAAASAMAAGTGATSVGCDDAAARPRRLLRAEGSTETADRGPSPGGEQPRRRAVGEVWW
jgi:hypothetical protein